MLAFKMLLRSWRGGQLGLMFSSLLLAVAVVTSVALLAERVERALVNESSAFLAADLVVSSSVPIDPTWLERAREMGVRTAQKASFSSMTFAGDQDMHLASIKAVESSYPLRGAVKRSSVPFATDELDIEAVESGPLPGQLWVDSRLLPLLNIKLGDTIDVGDGSFEVSHILIEEPDSGSSFSAFGARILMNWSDLPASGVIQPGSRVSYRFLIASSEGREDSFNSYADWLREQLDIHDRLITPDEAQASIASTMDKGRRFLLLAGSIGVVLAGIALALASHHFANRQLLQVALFKSWGISASRVRKLYIQQILLLGIAGSVVGLLIGWGFHQLLISVVRDWLPITLPAAGSRPWITGFATGILCLLGFTLPALWHLPTQSPLAVLRRDSQAQSLSSLMRGSLGVLTVAVLLYWYSGNLYMSMAIMLGFAITAGASIGVGLVLLRLGKSYGHWMGSIWRLALSNLWRRKKPSLIQMVGFSGAIALLMIMLVVRTSLVDEWRWQLADNAPNHFLINVAAYELDGVKTLVEQRELETAGWYSMVRGRITHLKNQMPSAVAQQGHESLHRELNLSWTSALPEGNSIVQGAWWDADSVAGNNFSEGLAPVSLEEDLLHELGLALGDTIGFSVGGLTFDAVVTSTRSLNWDSMTPNFYFLFPEGYLEDYPRTHMTSLYIPAVEKLLVNDLLRSYPTVQVIELDKIIDRIRTIVSQVTRGLEMMTLMILGCGILVMFAAVSLSMRERLQESALLRTLGSTRRLILGVQWVEFTTLGLMAGLLAALGAEFAVAMLQRFMFSLPFSWHPWLWIAGPLGGGLLVGVLGVVYSRRAVVQPPLRVLNSL
jgi:putative ABC transport system permease protein